MLIMLINSIDKRNNGGTSSTVEPNIIDSYAFQQDDTKSLRDTALSSGCSLLVSLFKGLKLNQLKGSCFISSERSFRIASCSHIVLIEMGHWPCSPRTSAQVYVV